jgi:thioredoxin reductase (NADPH)
VAKPIILTVDDDAAVSQAITRDLRKKYGSEFQIVRATSGADGLTVLTQFALRARHVALIVSDQRMPVMTSSSGPARMHPMPRRCC